MEEDKKIEKDLLASTSHTIYQFKCCSCETTENAQYKGMSPPFSRNITLKYPSYVMKDPFSPPGKGEILVLGGDCAHCGRSVCINKECSAFYLKLFCIDCLAKNIDNFPIELQSKLKIKK